MARKTTAKTTRRKTTKTAKRFQFQLGWSGLFGVTVVTFCLFLWMFMLGVWAGQTILLPPKGGRQINTMASKLRPAQLPQPEQQETLPAIRPAGKKVPLSK
ncbi:MAG: hypothetical protein CSB34_02350 [Desulfobulbus propionicus]|nr:MAG: hypothetical protein CSB34_02350 [Desulfobulbus propionicus]